MGFLSDFLPVFKKYKIIFYEKRNEAGNVVTFFFKYDQPIKWKAGQHGIISFPKRLKGGSWRGFSLASHPDEGTVMISTRIFDKSSAFKKALMDLKPGDHINLRGPFGPFYLDGSKRPVVFIAGGIGITPFRSLIQYSVRNSSQAPSSIRLFYSDDNGEYVYKNEFDGIASKNDFIKVDYITSQVLYDRITDSVNELANNALYYISGSKRMVTSIKKTLMDKGISKSNIRYEPFIGL